MMMARVRLIMMITLLVGVTALTACGPSDAQIATAIAQTQELAVMATFTPAPTEPPTETPTPTDTPSETPTSTPTSDIRVIDENPRNILLTLRELPADGRFYLVDETPGRNSEILSSWGVTEGQRYLEASGRIDGWTILWARGTRTVRVPEWLEINTILYKGREGPGFATETLGRCEDKVRSTIPWKSADPPDIGDDSYLCIWRETQPNGKDYLTYELWFARRNVAVQLWVGGYEEEFDLDWLTRIAELQLDKIDSFPLSDTVTFSP